MTKALYLATLFLFISSPWVNTSNSRILNTFYKPIITIYISRQTSALNSRLESLIDCLILLLKYNRYLILHMPPQQYKIHHYSVFSVKIKYIAVYPIVQTPHSRVFLDFSIPLLSHTQLSTNPFNFYFQNISQPFPHHL